ncbi:hypothetical protein [Rhodococcus phenolicus]|uniref:hypothetical protein n=1 Tax=Rhodococcus phenolicus TaxID=263849 RepID=UPI0012E89B26|nr:hypothetical protein [Rhodococcus phenolicus]
MPLPERRHDLRYRPGGTGPAGQHLARDAARLSTDTPEHISVAEDGTDPVRCRAGAVDDGPHRIRDLHVLGVP